MTGCTVTRYGQLETSPETIAQELRPLFANADRQTDRQTDRHTDRQTDRQTYRQTDRQTYGEL